MGFRWSGVQIPPARPNHSPPPTMKTLLKDALIGLAVACAVVALLLFAAFNSTFIYRGF